MFEKIKSWFKKPTFENQICSVKVILYDNLESPKVGMVFECAEGQEDVMAGMVYQAASDNMYTAMCEALSRAAKDGDRQAQQAVEYLFKVEMLFDRSKGHLAGEFFDDDDEDLDDAIPLISPSNVFNRNEL